MRTNKNKKAQSTLEFTLTVIVVIAALLAMGVYLKRGLQGKYRATADDIGDQYAPQNMNTYVYTGSDTTRISEVRDAIDLDQDGKPDEPFDRGVYYWTDNRETSVQGGFEEALDNKNEKLF